MERINSESVRNEQLKRYLYAELNDAERAEVDEKLFADDALFHEALSIENELVDLYASGSLSGEELSRFERSLGKVPERRAKVANAVALHAYIEEEKRSESTEAPVWTAGESRTGWKGFVNLFVIKPALAPAMASLMILLIAAVVFLIVENRRRERELARVETEKQELESVWQSQITNTSQSLNELKSELGDKDEERGELVTALSSEQQRIQELEKELDRLRDKNSVRPPERSSGPVIAAIALKPMGPGSILNQTSTARLGENTKRLAINLSLPSGVRDNEPLAIHLNEKIIARNVLPSTTSDGKKTLSVSIPTQDALPGSNKLMVTNAAGQTVTEYAFEVNKP